MTLQTGNLVIGGVASPDSGLTTSPWLKAPKAFNTFSVLGAVASSDTALTVPQWPKVPKAFGTFSTVGAYAPPISQSWG